MSLSSSPSLTGTFLVCTPIPTALSTVTAATTVYTTTYSTVLQAACPTSQWIATYTIVEVCTGSPAEYVTPVIPPGFVVTTVSCGVCDKKAYTVTCPGANVSAIPGLSIEGNGITANMTATVTVSASPAGIATPNAAPTTGGAAAPGAAGNAGAGGASAAPTKGASGNSPVVVAGATSLKRSLALFSGFVLVVGQFVVA